MPSLLKSSFLSALIVRATHVTFMDSHPASDESHVRVAIAKVLGLIGACNETELRSIAHNDFIALLSAKLSELLRL
jgi:hypothetical protein